jgi:phosphohistidine phosphatase
LDWHELPRHNVVMTRRLIVVRHASAEASARDGSDHSRALDSAGRRALPWLAAEVDSLGPVDLVLASTATRVRETVGGMLAGIRSTESVAISWSAALYLADVDVLFDGLREIAPAHTHVVVCGHNPGLHQLVLELDSGNHHVDLARGLPTAAFAAFDIDAPWAAIAQASGRLAAFGVPPRRH